MKYVLDSCVGLKTVLPEKDTDLALAFMAEFKNQIHELIAPDCYIAECANAITKAERRKLVKPPQGQEKFELILESCPALYPHVPLLPRAFEISSSIGHGFYDSILVALGELEGCQVVTVDERFAKKFPNEVVLLTDL